MMADVRALTIPVRITRLPTSVLIEVNPGRSKGSTTIVPLTVEGDEWKESRT